MVLDILTNAQRKTAAEVEAEMVADVARLNGQKVLSAVRSRRILLDEPG